MRIPVYCRESMELLTVVEVPMGLIGRPRIQLAAYPLLRLAPGPDDPIPHEETVRTVELDMVRLHCTPSVGDTPLTTWLALTRQGEHALLLRAELLPGQRTHLHRTAWNWRVLG